MPTRVNFVRYADDFVVTAATPELALEAKELIREFLAERGLELSDEKTVVTNIDDGFDFLGWNFRKYNEKLIIKPSKKAVKAIVSNISDTILRRGKAWRQDVLIMKLNEQIRGVGLITTSPYAQVMRSRIWTMSCTNCCGDGLKDGTQRRTSGGFPRDTGIVSVIGTGCSLRKTRS